MRSPHSDNIIAKVKDELCNYSAKEAPKDLDNLLFQMP